MKREVLIHKVVITAEAKFDYEEVMELGKLPRTDIKNLIEDYLSLKDVEFQDCCVRYFSVNYLDDVGGCLKLFLYKGERFGSMQMWKLAGICNAEDWHKENDEEGLIRHWLKSKVENIPKEQDWAVVLEDRIKLGHLWANQELTAMDKDTRQKIRNGDFIRKR